MRKKHITRTAAISLVLVFLLTISVFPPVSASETAAPRASYYLDSYNAYGYSAGWGKMQFYFNVTGVTYMDELGALTVQIYESTDQENWTWVETIRHTTQPDMLGYNDIYHSGHVDYKGTIGRYYKAYVTIWAGKDGDGDARYMWTYPRKATLFAE